MKLKLDENLGRIGEALLREDDHDVATVSSQGLTGTDDQNLIERCRDEGRCLVSLDLGFADPLHFRPHAYEGIVVIRMPGRSTPALLRTAMETLRKALQSADPRGRLWIVEPGRVRYYQPLEEGE